MFKINCIIFSLFSISQVKVHNCVEDLHQMVDHSTGDGAISCPFLYKLIKFNSESDIDSAIKYLHKQNLTQPKLLRAGHFSLASKWFNFDDGKRNFFIDSLPLTSIEEGNNTNCLFLKYHSNVGKYFFFASKCFSEDRTTILCIQDDYLKFILFVLGFIVCVVTALSLIILLFCKSSKSKPTLNQMKHANKQIRLLRCNSELHRLPASCSCQLEITTSRQ